MNRKTSPHGHIADARTVSARTSSAASAIFDPVEFTAMAMRTVARMSECVQEIELAQLNAFTNCSSAIAAAAVAAQSAPGLDGALPALAASGDAVVAGIRESQDAWRRSTASLQEDLLRSMRDRADAARARLQEAWTAQTSATARQPLDPIDVVTQARQSFDAWMTRWAAMVIPQPAATA
jgi:hypothetical protein